MSNDNVPGTFPLSSPDPTGRTSIDAGTLDLGIDSAWTCGDEVTTGVERSLSQRAEPPTSDQLSSDSWLGALGAPSKLSLSAPDISDDGTGSAPMSISPILGSVVGLHTSRLVVGENNKNDASSVDDEVSTMLSAHMSWFDLPDDDELGAVPEFPVMSPSVRALESTPRVIYEPSVALKRNEQTISKERPHQDERTEKWASATIRQQDGVSEHVRNVEQHVRIPPIIDDLQKEIRELESLVIESQTRELESHQQLLESRRAPTRTEKGHCEHSVRVQPQATKTHFKMDTSPIINLKPTESSRFQ
ncbi:uncharacterized protein F5147DRAFT_809199 [Suillus discolor]|uniref:Uncharacterized protein n=1 Tax=Suillus discolor TaxID=1912936 RepID=A0A9P7F326_9AGAM|nr:uncharacterized protein F5147DRAFT_809199 [Suillus discolor]KAG2103459.1 hypothetical protein F5147DRAFT_809199 [Suillus discolor]